MGTTSRSGIFSSIGFDGSSGAGFSRLPKSDLLHDVKPIKAISAAIPRRTIPLGFSENIWDNLFFIFSFFIFHFFRKRL